MNKTKIVGISIAALSLVLIILQATKSDSTVTFYTPEEIYASIPNFENKLFRVSGLVIKESKKFDPMKQDLQFRISDLKGHEFNVSYKGVPPDLFKEGQGVVVEGRLQPEKVSANFDSVSNERSIKASLLMVKHSEVYDTQSEHSDMRKAKLIDSIQH